jgi:hypothetical protein
MRIVIPYGFDLFWKQLNADDYLPVLPSDGMCGNNFRCPEEAEPEDEWAANGIKNGSGKKVMRKGKKRKKKKRITASANEKGGSKGRLD